MSAIVTSATAMDQLRERLYDVNALQCAMSVMDWDQQTLMPRGGAAARAEHLGVLSRMHHELSTSTETGNYIEAAAKEAASDDDQALVRIARRVYNLATKLPTSLVAEKTRLAAIAHEDWVKARATNDFKSFAPTLERMFDIVREEAGHYGYTNHIYDALIDLYEEGATYETCKSMFDEVKPRQVALVKQIMEKPIPDDSALHGEWNLDKQREFGRMLVTAIGFDMDRGRQDEAPHPFCTGWSVGDIRLTTRYMPYIGSGIFGSLHEAGHGMYEQGSPKAWDRLPLAGGVSLGVHESQSRTWENIVGRSRSFWVHFLPKLKQYFPALDGQELDSFYKAVNKVEPTFIRVEADELTYNLHVLVRFEIECAVLTGQLKVADMPEAWNAKYTEYLGITPPTDAKGCLQDVHWSMGSIGYFPTYSMGNLLSYQIWNTLRKDVGDTGALIAKGEFKPILDWLIAKVYSKGSKYPPKELVQQVTGKPLGAADYLDGLEKKYSGLYGL